MASKKSGGSPNNETAPKEASARDGMGGTDNSDKEGVFNKVKKLPFPETYTNKQGSTNGDMDMRAPTKEKNEDFVEKNFSSENKNPNNESYAKSKQPKGAGMGLGVIGRLANSGKWGNVGNS